MPLKFSPKEIKVIYLLCTARELSGTIKENLGTAQSMCCSVDGRHLHDIIDDISSHTVDAQLVKITKENISVTII
ncbi:60S ribosomal protein L12 [Myotis davidii]|uniref:60S ribosomal protein L12 n=1 Tax=Myotis davidii TaxID=225400 RepID=L5MGV1_MYODS|nr:60S ribosomal protein L12 [Myotis davidii]